jgi:antitoxin component of RelBE/YafQ-DinJ toxin-antitoxin module
MAQFTDERKGDTPLRNVRVDDTLWAEAKAAAAANGTNPSEVMRRALVRYVKTHPVDAPAETGAH